MGMTNEQSSRFEYLIRENDRLTYENKQLKKENAELKRQLEKALRDKTE